MRERVGEIVAELADRRRSTRTSSPRRAPCSVDAPTTTSRSSATASTTARRGRGGRAACGPRLGPRDPAREPTSGRSRQLRAAAAGGAAAGARADPAHPDEGELAGDRPPARLPRLHRRQALRRRRRGGGRAALPRPLHAHRLQREPVGDPGAAPQGARGCSSGRACCPAATTTRRWSRSSRPTRATSCSRSPRTSSSRSRSGILHLRERQRVRLFVRRDAFGRFCPASSTCRATGSTPSPAPDRGHPPGGVRRRRASTTHARLRVGAGPAPHRRPHRARRVPEYDVAEIEARLAAATRAWTDDLRDALVEQLGEERAARSSRGTARRSPPPTATTSPPGRPCSTSSASSGSTPTATSG